MEHKVGEKEICAKTVSPSTVLVLRLDWLVVANSCLFLYSDVSMSKVLLGIKGDNPLRMI